MPNAAFKIDAIPLDPTPGQIIRKACHHRVCRSKTHLYAWVVCPFCKSGRWQWVQTWHRERLRTIGPEWVCNRCAQRGRRGSPANKIVNSGGYIWVVLWEDDPMFVMTSPDSRRNGRGYVLEHRLVVARGLGRSLTSYEQVHHKNGNRQDNRLENLELWIGRQPTGVRLEDFHCACCRYRISGNSMELADARNDN